MSAPNVIGFRIASEKVAQLDLIAKSMSRDRSYLLNKAVDAYLGLATLVEEQVVAPRERELIPDGDAEAKLCSRMPERSEGVESVSGLQSVSESPIPSMHAGPYMFLAPPPPPNTNTETKVRVQLPTLIPGTSDGRLLIFLSAKGGSGVTTVACNFAVSLARESGKRILFIDLNLPLGDATIDLGIKSRFSTMNAFHNLSRLDAGFLSTLLERHSSGLYVLAAPSELAVTEEVSREAIDKLLEVARLEFDYVVVDAGSRMDPKQARSFDETTIIYLVTQIGIPELRNSNRLISEFPLNGGPTLEIVINRFDCRSQAIDEQHVTGALTRAPRWKIPNDYAAVRRMQNTATPFMGENSPISRTIQQMARYICGRPRGSEQKRSISILGWTVSHV